MSTAIVVYCLLQLWLLTPFVVMAQAYNQFRVEEGL